MRGWCLRDAHPSWHETLNHLFTHSHTLRPAAPPRNPAPPAARKHTSGPSAGHPSEYLYYARSPARAVAPASRACVAPNTWSARRRTRSETWPARTGAMPRHAALSCTAQRSAAAVPHLATHQRPRAATQPVRCDCRVPPHVGLTHTQHGGTHIRRTWRRGAMGQRSRRCGLRRCAAAESSKGVALRWHLSGVAACSCPTHAVSVRPFRRRRGRGPSSACAQHARTPPCATPHLACPCPAPPHASIPARAGSRAFRRRLG